MAKKRRRICIDFDGVIHWYRKGWQGADNIYDEPVPGAKEAVIRLAQDYTIHILSSRARESEGGIEAIEAWMAKYDIPFDSVSAIKEPGGVYIDDRGFRFKGDWDAVFAQLEDLDPWHKPNKRDAWGRTAPLHREILLEDLEGLGRVSDSMWTSAMHADLVSEAEVRRGFADAMHEAQQVLTGREDRWEDVNVLFRDRVVGYLFCQGQGLSRKAAAVSHYAHMRNFRMKQAQAYLAALERLGYPGRMYVPVEHSVTEVIAAKALEDVQEQIDEEVQEGLDPSGGDE